MDIELEWLQATLNDASEALQDALQKVENGDQEDALEVLNHDLVHVYAKLNYAVNTARLGPAALDAMSEDELIGWPARMPFLTFDESTPSARTKRMKKRSRKRTSNKVLTPERTDFKKEKARICCPCLFLFQCS